MKDYSIEQIAPAATLRVRQAELYPLMLLKKLQLEEDEDGIHFGLFHDDKLISVVSCFEKNDGNMYLFIMNFRLKLPLPSEIAFLFSTNQLVHRSNPPS